MHVFCVQAQLLQAPRNIDLGICVEKSSIVTQAGFRVIGKVRGRGVNHSVNGTLSLSLSVVCFLHPRHDGTTQRTTPALSARRVRARDRRRTAWLRLSLLPTASSTGPPLSTAARSPRGPGIIIDFAGSTPQTGFYFDFFFWAKRS